MKELYKKCKECVNYTRGYCNYYNCKAKEKCEYCEKDKRKVCELCLNYDKSSSKCKILTMGAYKDGKALRYCNNYKGGK